MAKKDTSQSATRSTSRARSRTNAAATPPAPIDAAADMPTHATGVHTEPATPHDPTYDEIADAAYHRFLSRGGHDGGDFDDWVEAERELRERRSR